MGKPIPAKQKMDRGGMEKSSPARQKISPPKVEKKKLVSGHFNFGRQNFQGGKILAASPQNIQKNT